MDVSLAIPCYNEGPHLEESVQKLINILEKTGYSFEIVLVDDCSIDNTAQIIENLSQRFDSCRGVFHEKNKGRGAAFKTGFRSCSGKVTGFIDIDLEVPAHYIPPLIDLIVNEDYDVAIGHRHYLLSQTGGLHRHFLSIAYRILCNLLIGHGVKDSETGCKFFKRETASSVVLSSRNDGWFWDTEVMTRANLANLKIAEMPVVFQRNYSKKSTVRLLPDSVDYLRSLYKFRSDVGLSLKDKSPIYWTAIGYDLVMRATTGYAQEKAYKELADLIPEGSSVVDVCGGSAYLFRKYLRKKDIDYFLLDANGHFVLSAKRKKFKAILANVVVDPVPSADYVIVCSSYYHFRAREHEILEKLLASAKKAVIISEPVKNLSTSKYRLVRDFSSRFTRFGENTENSAFRYSREEFTEFARKNNSSSYVYNEGDKNAIAVFKSQMSVGS